MDELGESVLQYGLSLAGGSQHADDTGESDISDETLATSECRQMRKPLKREVACPLLLLFLVFTWESVNLRSSRLTSASAIGRSANRIRP